MKISVNCDKCGKKLKAPASLAGKRAKCSKCGAIVKIPMEQDASDDTGFELVPIEETPRTRTPKPPAPAPAATGGFDTDKGPLDLLDDLLEPELPSSALVEHEANAGAPAAGRGRGRGRGRGGAGKGPGQGGPNSGNSASTNALLARAAENQNKRGHANAPQPWFSLLGVDFTPVKSIVLLVILTLLIGSSTYYFTGPGKGVRIFEAQPVAAFVALDTLARHDVKGMAGISLGQMGAKPPVSPLGSAFAEERYGMGGPDRLIFTRPDPNGNYLLVHVKISQRVVAEEQLENRYDALFTADNFLMHVGNETVRPMLIMGKLPNDPLAFTPGNEKMDNVQGMLPAGIEPDEYQDLQGTAADLAKGTLVYNGSKGVTGTVSVSSNRRLFDQPGVSGVGGSGQLIQQDPYSGTTLKYDYKGSTLDVSWNGPATAWWSSDQYQMPAAISPFARFDIYLLYPRPQSASNMVIKVNNRVAGKLASSMSGKAGQMPAVVALGGTPIAVANPTVNTQTPATPTTPEEAAAAMAGGAGGTGGKPAAGSNAGGTKAADPGMFDYFGALARARDMGKGVVAENNMKQLGMGVLMYAEKNNGKLPPTIDHLRTEMGDINKLLENVRTNTNPGFLYIKPADNVSSVANPNSTPILYELRDGKLDRDGAIMYLDGHIELPKK